MDWNYGWALLSFAIGMAVAYRELHDYFRESTSFAFRSGWGWLYFGSRGMLPVVLFVAVRLLRGEPPEALQAWHPYAWHPFALAIASGIGAESLLRVGIVGRNRSGDEPARDDIHSLFKLLRWYESIVIRKIAAELSERDDRFIRDHLSEITRTSFLAMSGLVLHRAETYRWVDPKSRTELEARVRELEARFSDGDRSEKSNVRSVRLLCHWILDHHGPEALRYLAGLGRE